MTVRVTKRTGHLFIISGPSGAGKGSVLRAAAKKIDINLSVSVTNRPKRAGESSDRDYHFVDAETFDRLIKENKLLEWAELYGYKYGTPRDYVNKKIAQSEDVFLEIDVQGAKQVKEQNPDSILIFIMPPSLEELKRRLIERGSESAESIEKRINLAKNEVEATGLYDYVIVNDKIENAANKLIDVIKEVRHEKYPQT